MPRTPSGSASICPRTRIRRRSRLRPMGPRTGLGQEHQAQQDERVEIEALRGVLAIKGALRLRWELPEVRLAAHRVADRVRVAAALQRCGAHADQRPGRTSTSTPKDGDLERSLGRELLGDERAAA